MKPRPRHTCHARPAAALLAALLLLFAPTALVNVAAAQRRRSAPRKPAPPAATAPVAAPSESQRQQEVERPFDASIAADSYVVYVELRGLGRLVQTSEVRTALDAFRLLGGAPPELLDAIDFLKANEEALATVRVVAAGGPTRAGIPDGVAALQFPTPDSARAFEPKLRSLLAGVGEAFGPPAASADAAPRGRGASRRARQPKKTPPLVIKRAGSWIYAAPAPFTFKSLRGDGANLLADHARLQSFRSRLASESVFVYYETALWRRSFQLQQDEALKKQSELELAAETMTRATGPAVLKADPVLTPDDGPIRYGDPNSTTPPAGAAGATLTVEQAPTPAEAAAAEETPTPEATPSAEEVEAARAEFEKEVAREEAERKAASPKSAEERAARAMMTTLLSGVFGGSVREPEAIALGLGLEGDVLAARLLVSRDADAPNNIIPFFPNVVAGPPVTTESLAVAPADSEVFVSASFDWARIYDSLINTMNAPPSPRDPEAHGGDGADGAAPRGAEEGGAVMRPAGAEKGVEAMEKLFGFRLREDLLPALGSEVALSVPMDWFEGRRRPPGESEEPGADGEKKSEAGPVAIISLSNPDAVRKVLPLVLAALGLGSQQQAAAPPERRKGFDIHHLGGPAYAFVNNFLVVGETAPAVRHVVDANAANQTLASSTRFRESIAWQEQQRLASGYLSEELMRKYIDSTRRMAEGSTDPVVLAALAQLDVPPLPASYSATDKGDALLHELHVPVGLAKIFAASAVIGIKEAPVIGNETFVSYSLQRIAAAQEGYKTTHGQGRYGTLEELYAAKLLEKEHTLSDEYAYELRASGDKFTLTATPRNYGKTGRRSFFTDETGVVRAANHKGEPATAADPPAEQ